MLFELIVLLLAVPVGFLLAWLARDELVIGRKWFNALIVVGVIVGGWSFLIGQKAIALTCAFIVLVTFVSLVKSFDKKWVKKRI
ncbi:MAG: hypothetical protein KJ600_05685 [Nanoarchaeota archaeon]|nr:hypothetical protein [Nanoarchaeota archaeon]MBU1104020.1 hypothetical protein [Nanoarchaeota archaeon]